MISWAENVSERWSRGSGVTDRADRIIRQLGQGTFGKVVEARDVQTRKKVAIKVIRAVQKYRDASKIEIRVLETLKRHDANNLK
jgi:dual-specificity kinase